jgi:ABC-type nickel/cobalt efflux system permease component RcnA
LGLIVWIAGLAVAAKFGHWIEIISSILLIFFGLWVAFTGLPELRGEMAHEHAHTHGQVPDHHHHRDHDHGKSGGMALMLILGSSPMAEGLPAFFAAAKFGWGLIVIMSLVFAASTILTYVSLCVVSMAGLENVRLGPLEHYGEIISGLFIAAVGVVFWIFPVI